MINLLPPELKTGYSYARKNVKLRKWVLAFLIALVGLGVLGTFGLVAISQSSAHNRQQIAGTEAAFKQEDFEATQKKIQDISGSFKLAVNVLGEQVLFSQLLKQIAATIPSKANLTGLNISQVQGAIDITAVAPDYNTATQVQVNLADPQNKIFSKADIVSINCDNNAAGSAYPCTVNVRALFAKDNPFLFINSKGVKP
ncbi:MAG TPA: hypothetical protein VK534_01625 [Methylomirabilota bacterium]|nr:hypothetical protein [Methylomirabilota bacterium]